MGFVWSWALIVFVIIAAVFLVITLAQMEAGTKVKGKWLAYTLCSFAVVTALVIFRPKPNMEQVQYLPAPTSSQEQTTDLRGAAQQKTDAKAMESGSGLTGGEQSQGKVVENQGNQEAQGAGSNQGKEQGSDPVGGVDPILKEILKLKLKPQAGGEQSQGTIGENQGNQETQEVGGLEDQEQYLEPVGGVDPMLEEILALKQQAGQRKIGAEAAIEESNSEESSVSGAAGSVNQLNQGPEAQQKIDLYWDGETGKQTVEGNEKESQQPGQTPQQGQSQQVLRRKVVAATLNVRDKESLDGRVIGNLKSDDIVEVDGESGTGEWLKIKLNSGQTGWVMKKYTSVLP